MTDETNLNSDQNANLDNITLALLFAADEPLTVRRITSVLEDVDAADIKKSIEAWKKRFDDEAWSVAVERVAGGYQLVTRTDYGVFVGRLYAKRRKLRLSRAGMETLAIIAYKQPVTRAEIESVRGVGCGGVVANLMERSLIKITGKAKVLGAPFLYGTTAEFLEYLGLNSLKDLPSLEELEALLEREAYPESATELGETAEGPSVTDDDEDEERDFDEEIAADEDDLRDTLAAAGEDDDATDREPAPAPARTGTGSARLGPSLDEPVNRPLDEDEPDGTDDRTETPITHQATIDEREDER